MTKVNYAKVVEEITREIIPSMTNNFSVAGETLEMIEAEIEEYLKTVFNLKGVKNG